MRYLTMILLALFFTLSVGNPVFAQEPPAAEKEVPAAKEDAPKKVDAPAKDADTKAEDTKTEDPKKAEPVPVVDPKVPETDGEAGALISKLLDYGQNGHWTLFAGVLLLLLIWGFNKLGLAKKVGRKWVPWVTLGIAAVASIGVGLASGESIWDAAKLGLLEGGLAIALWELIAKHLSKSKSDGTSRVAASDDRVGNVMNPNPDGP